MRSQRLIPAGVFVLWAAAAATGLGQTRTVGTGATVPAGTILDVTLRTALGTATTRADQAFEAGLIQAVEVGGQAVIPAGTPVRGFVGSVGGLRGRARQAQLTLAFSEIGVEPRAARLRATVVDILDPKRLIAPPNAELGPVFGSRGNAQLAGVRARDGGTIVSTEGGDVTLPLGAILRIRLDEPIAVPAGR